MHLGLEAARLAALVRTITAHVTLWDRLHVMECEVCHYLAAPQETSIMAIWRYCPNCYTLADSNSLLKRCAKCPGIANNLLQVLPLNPEAAQSVLRIGGQQALIHMILTLIGGDTVQAELDRHHNECAYSRGGGYCDMYCLQGGLPLEDPEL